MPGAYDVLFASNGDQVGMILYRVLTDVDDAAFCHRLTEALNRGWKLHGSPNLAYDATRQALVCEQAITEEVKGVRYDPSVDPSTQ